MKAAGDETCAMALLDEGVAWAAEDEGSALPKAEVVARTVLKPDAGAGAAEDAGTEAADDVAGADAGAVLLEGAEAVRTGAEPDEAALGAPAFDPSTWPGGAVGGGGEGWAELRILPVPQGMGEPSGWLELGGEDVAPLGSDIAKRPVQVVFWSWAVNW